MNNKLISLHKELKFKQREIEQRLQELKSTMCECEDCHEENIFEEMVISGFGGNQIVCESCEFKRIGDETEVLLRTAPDAYSVFRGLNDRVSHD